MREWSTFTAEEIERRRVVSVQAIKEREQADFNRKYQEHCDRLYWTRGQCCAGCDHWQSDMALTGRCAANGIVSGADVLHSMGVTFSSYTPPPGFPFTGAEHHCGLFKDDFDWSKLGDAYLSRIGAMKDGKIKPKPAHLHYAAENQPAK